MPVKQDMQVFPVMVAIRDAIAEQLQCAPLGPVGRYDIIARDRPDMRGCDCDGGRFWIRYMGQQRIENGSGCASGQRIGVELAILRCLPADDSGSGPMPTSAAYFQAAGGFMGDVAAIRRTMTHSSLKKAWLDEVLPYGPQASCMGTRAVIRWKQC